MAAFIKKLFKNRKSDSGPASVDLNQLNPDDAKDLDTLIEFAQSAETNSQKAAAVEKIPHIKHLIPLYPDASAALRNILAQRISQLAQGSPGQIQDAKNALAGADLQTLIQQLCEPSPTDHEQVSADTDPAQLLKLAIEGKTAAVRLAAAEKIEAEDDLLSLQKAAKGRDKGVYQLTRKKLQALRQDQAEARKTQDAIDELVRQTQEHARTDNMQLYSARVDSLQSQWRNLSAQASTEQQTAFLSAMKECQDRIREAEAASEREAESDRKQTERQATLELLQQTLDDLKASVDPRGPSLSSLDALQKTQENRWMEATRETEVGKAEQKDYQALMHDLRQYISAVQRLHNQQEQLDNLLASEQPDSGQLRHLLDDVDWPDDFARPEAIAAAARTLGHVQKEKKAHASDQKEQQKTLDQLLDRLETALEQDHFAESRQLHKQAQHAFNALDHKHAGSRHARLTLLGRQLKDLQDWRGFATRPKQEELCEAMEYLATQHMEPEVKATHIKELQQEWRDLGGSSDQSLWQRFKQASDKAYEPCQAYFAAKSELKHVNIEKREAICQQLEAFAENADWHNVDWKAVERIHRVAREEWREAWPIDFKANRPLQKRFDRLLKQIEAPLNEERRRNEARKQEIVDQAEALISHEPLQEAMERAKTLQKDWQAVGITRHREDRKLWQAFRAACDAIFARRDAQRAEQAAADTAAVETVRQRISESQAQREQAGNDPALLRNALDTLKKTATPRKLPADVNEALSAERRALESAIGALERSQQTADWEARLQRFATEQEAVDSTRLPESLPAPREIAVRLEIATGQPSPEADQELRMKQQVERLAAGMGSSNPDTSRPETEIERLVDCWCAQAISADDAEQLLPRLLQVLAQWKAG
ncbi:DUF349 domain-containing protein [Marinobacter bohaiensis]|uniref:DUF349 domain-containing protein n=1 Tax=Marinobacter bohaiensis TaxID=2201898 RepID=UPI000DAEF1D9|nr:DUF349 domain-containing protein [Marinobacter bohaiensis]